MVSFRVTDALLPEETAPDTPWVGRWTGPTADLEAVETRLFALLENLVANCSNIFRDLY
jgi:hypothetical protein